MSKETRRLKRAQDQRSANDADASKASSLAARSANLPDPFGKEQRKSLLVRLGLPLLAIWMLCGFIASVVVSHTAKAVLLGVPALVTLLALGLLVWVLRQAKKARGVASILRKVETSEDRKAALAELDSSYKKGDTAAVFARAQLEMQEDPRKALATLEQINLGKVLSPVADEARAQRAMIHLMLGEASRARELVDAVELGRHQEPRTRAMLAAVCAEAWARTGLAKKAVDTLALLNPDDEAFREVQPQLYRANAYAAAHVGDAKAMRRALKKLSSTDPRLLGGFLVKRTHPLLQKEAKRMLEQSGAVPKRMIVQRG